MQLNRLRASSARRMPRLSWLHLLLLLCAGSGSLLPSASASADSGGAIITTLTASVLSPFGVAVDSNGNVYVANQIGATIQKVDTAGNVSTFAGTGTLGYSGDGGPATSAQLSSPIGMAVDSSGNVYIADQTNSRIRKVDTSGNISTFAGTGTPGYSGDGGLATSAQLSNPVGVAVDSSGNVYIADQTNSRIRKVDTSGNISTFAGTGTPGYSGDGGPAISAQLFFPFGVAVDSSGNVYIADQLNARIRKVDTSGNISTFAGTGTPGYSGDGGPATSAQLSNPLGVAVDSSGNVYISDLVNNRIRKVDTSGNISTFAGTGVFGYSGDGGPATSAQLSSPFGVAVDNSGNVYIADLGNNRIRKVAVIHDPVAVDDTATTAEDTPILLGVLSNDSDEDIGDILSVTTFATPLSGSVGLSGTTHLVYTPTLNFFGADSFTYTIVDTAGLTATATVSLTITPVNDAPTASDDSYSTMEDGSKTVSAPGLLSNDSDIEGDNLTALLVSGPSHGSLTLNADGSFTYTPTPAYSGSDSFTYQANDGVASSSAVTVNLTVTPKWPTTVQLEANPNPAIVGQSVTLTATVNNNVQLRAVNPTGSVTFKAGATVLGTAPLNGYRAVLTKSDWVAGAHLVTAYYEGDSYYATSTSAAVDLRIQALPTAVNDAVGTLQGQIVTVTVLTNDLDPAGGGLSVVLVNQPAHGVAAITAGEQTVTYTPAQDFQGIDSFSYTVRDSNGNTDEGLASIVVSAPDSTTGAPQIGLVDPNTETQLSFPGSQVQLNIALPVNVYSNTLGVKDIFYLSYTQGITDSEETDTNNLEEGLGNLRFGNLVFDLSAYVNGVQLDHFVFASPVTVTLTYDPALLESLQLSTLTLLYWNGTTWSDDGITVLNHDLVNHRLTVMLTHLSEFAFFASVPATPDPDAIRYLHLPMILQVGPANFRDER